MTIVTVNRPRVLNALNAATLDELDLLAAALTADDSVRAVILTGAGERAFAAGADIRELLACDAPAAQEYARRGQQAFARLERMGKPVIAAVNGFALGGGCELAMACTFRLAADSAQFGMPEVDLGLMPGFAGTVRLPRLVGRGIALDLLLTGRQIGAREAREYGLVHQVVPAASLMNEARRLADALAAKAPLAMRAIIDAVGQRADLTPDEGAALEAKLFGQLAGTADMREGVRAFLEKRTPVFRGE